MASFLQDIAGVWKEFCKRRRYAREISPSSLEQLAQDLAHLAEIVERGPDVTSLEAHFLHSLKDEMQSLIAMTRRPEFHRLSADRRLALHRSLHRSLRKLLASVQAAPSSTERIQ